MYFPKRKLLSCLLFFALFMSLFSSLTPVLPCYFPTAQATSTSPFSESLYVNSMNNASTQWSTDGNCPYLTASGLGDIYTSLSQANGTTEGNFGFSHTTNTVLVNVYLYVQALLSSSSRSTAGIYDASGTLLGTLHPTSTSYAWYKFDVAGVYNTPSKVNSALIYFKFNKVNIGPSINVQRAYLAINSPVLTTQNAFVSGFSSSHADWATTGSYPYINNASGTHNIHVAPSSSGGAWKEGNFNFSFNQPFIVQMIFLYVEAYSNVSSWGSGGSLKIYMANNTLLETISSLTTSYAWYSFNVTTFYSTASSIRSASIYFQFTMGSTAAIVYIDRCYLSLTGLPSVNFYNFKGPSQDQPSQTATFYLNSTTTQGATLADYIVSTDNQHSWRVMANGSVTAFSSGLRTQNASFQITLNSTGDRFVSVQVFACNNYGAWNSTFLSFFVWNSETNAYSPRDRGGLLGYINETDAIMNMTFPYSRGGSSSYTNKSTAQLFDGVFLYLQTGNAMYIQGSEWLCQWLNTTQSTNLQHLFETYTYPTGWPAYPSTIPPGGNSASEISELAVYATIVPKWKPLLQKIVNKWISMFLPLTTYRVYGSVYVNGSVYDTASPLNGQDSGIEAMTLASHVLNNMTLKNIAYKMIQSWVGASSILPYNLIKQNGAMGSNGDQCKEDQFYADFMFALEEFYYYYPTNTTERNWLYAYAFNSEYFWNSTYLYWDYQVNATSGKPYLGGFGVSVHGFGMIDEAVYSAYLIFGSTNTTWEHRARQDFDTNTIKGFYNGVPTNGDLVYNGTIEHSEALPQSDDVWAVYARRFSVELYDLTNKNSTYLRAANYLFWNFTLRSQRQYGLQSQIDLRTGRDWYAAPNARDPMQSYAVYINLTTDGPITTFPQLIGFFGLPALGSLPNPITVTLVTPKYYVPNSLTITFQYKAAWFIQPANTSLWTNRSGVWQPVVNITNVVLSKINNVTYTYPTSGRYVWNIKSSDGTYYYSGLLNYTVIAASVHISPSSTILDLSQSRLFTSSVSDFPTYQWYLNNTKVLGATSPTWAFTPSSVGSYTVYLNCTYFARFWINSSTSLVTVNNIPVVTISPTSGVLDIPQSQFFSSAVVNGTSPFTYQWYLNGAPVSGENSVSWTWTPSSAGSYTIYMNVTDATGYEAKSNSASFTVNPRLSVSVSPASVVMDVGQSKTFTANVSGGTTPYTYKWYLDGVLINGATSSTWMYTPASSGSHTVYCNVTDSATTPYSVQSNAVPVTINTAPTVTVSPTNVTIYVGHSQDFVSLVSGGTSPYTYQWYLNNNPVPGATSSSWTFTPSSAGIYSIYVNVTDSVAYWARSNTTWVTVFNTLSVVISPSSVTMYFGQSQQFTSNATGGMTPYSYQWYCNGSAVSGATSPTWTFRPSSAGFYTVYLKVTDKLGTSVTSNIANVTVSIYTGQPFHDVAVTNVTSSKTIVGQGISVNLTITVINLGNYTETFKVTAYAGGTPIASQNITLTSGEFATITLTWNTTGFAYGNYTISAYAWPVPSEINIANNNFTGGLVEVTIPGDVNGDGVVNILDVGVIAVHWLQAVPPSAPPELANADVNDDGVINILDVGVIAVHWLQTIP
jgi:hypothetical protein